MATTVNVISHFHDQNHYYFTKILRCPPPILTPFIFFMPPKSLPLNPNAEAFYPQKLMRSIKESKIIPFPNNVEEVNVSSTTTVMIRNIPNQFRFRDLLFILDEHCFQDNKNSNNPTDLSKYDFVYLPMDYRKHAFNGRMSNLGYAFVNFTTPTAAFKFYNQFHRFAWNVAENRKICEITRAQIQGSKELTRVFRNKVFKCESKDFLPMLFPEGRDGLNRKMKGSRVGKHVQGIPALPIGNRAYFQNQ